MDRVRVIFLVGQTASGKGAAGALLAARIGAEIISLDSMKVYRGMDIGTAKPLRGNVRPETEDRKTEDSTSNSQQSTFNFQRQDRECRSEHRTSNIELRTSNSELGTSDSQRSTFNAEDRETGYRMPEDRKPETGNEKPETQDEEPSSAASTEHRTPNTVLRYHMIDVADPGEHFSTALYVAGAERAVAEIVSRGRVPLFVGGTALYLKAITEGLFEGPGADPELRAELRRQAERFGIAALHQRLAKVDPDAAGRIHPNDLRRIERALEVYEKTGQPISKLQQQFGTPNEKYDAILLGVRRDKADLHERIDRRVDAMIAKGLLDEVKRVGFGPRPLGKEASQALGYPELLAHLRGECSLAEAVAAIKQHTRQFAKAQMTWFKRFENIEWFDVAPAETPEQVAERMVEFLEEQQQRKQEQED